MACVKNYACNALYTRCFKVLLGEMFNNKILCASVILRNMSSQAEQYRLCCSVHLKKNCVCVCSCCLLGMYMLKFVGNSRNTNLSSY
jgi:hypothetical protein